MPPPPAVPPRIDVPSGASRRGDLAIGPPEQEGGPWTDPEARRLARKRLEARRDLGAHAVVYIVVNAFLVLVWALTGQGYFWPAWVMGAWGIGLVLNVWEVYFRRPVTEADVENELRRSG